MKKIFLSFILILSMCVSVFFVACGTKYDDIEIMKIETVCRDYMSAYGELFTREFDFESCKVTDNVIVNEDILQREIDYCNEYPEYLPEQYDSVESYEAELHEWYNNPKVKTEFTAEQGAKLIKNIKKLGFLKWKDSYEIPKDMVDDGGDETVTVYFSDGTTKSTYIFYKYPKNYYKIREQFLDILGVSFYYN